MTPGRSARGVRAALFAAVCVLLAATGHILMSGRPVAGWALCAAFAATAAAAWGPAARERGLLAVTAGAVVVQTVLHSVFSWAQSDDGALDRVGGVVGLAPMSDAAMSDVSMSDAPMSDAPMAHLTMGHVPMVGADMIQAGHAGHAAMTHLPATHLTDLSSLSASFGMLAAHLLAALLSGLWLAYGERAAFRLLRALPAGLFRPLGLLLGSAPAPDDRPRVRPVRPGDERAPRRLHLAHSLVSRGPPRAGAVV